MSKQLKLTDREWKAFAIATLFDIKDGYYNKKPPTSENGTIPFLGATQYQNGITGFYDEYAIQNFDKVGDFNQKDTAKRIFKGNCIAITNNGSVGHAYYQQADFACSHDITPIYLKKRTLNKYLALFIIQSLKKTGESFAYAKKWRPKRMRKSNIMLPIDKSENPDWQFMEDFIKQKEAKQKADLKNYYAEKAKDLMFGLQDFSGKEWQAFYLKDYFQFERGNQNNMAQAQSGDFPLVSAKKIDNGYKDFIAENGKKRFPKHIISLNNDGDGGIGLAYYQPVESYLDTHVTALIPKQELSKFTMLFIANSISQQRDKFSHGYSLNNARLNAQQVMLPTDQSGNPDWQFMHDFMQKIEQDKIQTVLNYYNNCIKNIKRGGVNDCFVNKKFIPFAISEVCEIKSGVRLTKQEMQNGKMPFIGASDSNNGVTEFIGNVNASLDKNVLGVNYNGSVVENFYHPYECLFSDDVKRLEIKDEEAKNKYVYLFLKTAILQQKSKYQYGYKFNATRMVKQKILLPVTTENQPDWQFMASYMQRLELTKIIKCLQGLHR